MAKKIIGICTCIIPGCNEKVHVQEAENNTLSYRCVPCDYAPYFKAGTDANRAIRKITTLRSAPAPVPIADPIAAAKKPDPAPAPPAPAPVKRNTVFG